MINGLKEVGQGILEEHERTATTWYGSIALLQDLQDNLEEKSTLNELLAAWIKLGTALGLDGKSECDRFAIEVKATRLCSWRECTYHTSPYLRALIACKGPHGREGRYCSAACQRR